MSVIKNILKLSTIIAVCVALSACHSVRRGHGAAGMGEGGAQASGIGEQNGFGEGYAADKLKAPANQIYHFEFDKYEVQQDDVASINAQANYLTAHKSAKVRIEGNADERGSREYNIALGWRRAKAVAAILEQQGVATSQIVMISYGKEKPVSLGHDEESFRLNRRAELVYEAK
jgi:peptidoglycan-associated lipoprotein